MAHFGGGTKLGGGTQFGGGPSKYERLQILFLDWLGRGAFSETVAKASGGVLWRLFGALAGQFEGAEVDAERIYTEGTPCLANETLDEWEVICFVERVVESPGARQWFLEKLMNAAGGHISPTEADTIAEEFLALTGSGLSTTCTPHTCTIAECTTANNDGDGVRYWGVMVPEWAWTEQWRPYYYLLLQLMERIDPTYCEASLPIDNDGGTPAEPAFYVRTTSYRGSIVDRDVLRD